MRTAGGSHNLSVSCADSIPTPFVPSGHFPLIGGIGPWKGSQGGPYCRRYSELGSDLSASTPERGALVQARPHHAFPYEGKVARRSRDG